MIFRSIPCRQIVGATGHSHYMEHLRDGQNRRFSFPYPSDRFDPYHSLESRFRLGWLRKKGFPLISHVWRIGGMVVSITKIDAELLRIMVCPVAHAPLVQLGDWLYSTDPATRRRYPIRDGIPIMLIEESEVTDQAEFERVMAETSNTK